MTVEPKLTVSVKREMLTSFCGSTASCGDCPLDGPVCRCGSNAHFAHTAGPYAMTDDEIEEAWGIVFCNRAGDETPAFRRPTPPPAPTEERQHHFLAGCRPCEVGGQPALFHRWVEEEKGVLIVNFFATEDMADSLRRKFEKDGIVAGGCSLEKLRQTLALIEWPGGTVATVPVGMIRFTDREG